MFKFLYQFRVLVIILIAVVSCKKDNISISVVHVQFVIAKDSVTEFGSPRTVTLTFATPLEYSGNLNISVFDSTATYGSTYTTLPDGSSKTISIPVESGATSASFKILPIQKSLADGDKIVNFLLAGLPRAVQAGSIAKQIVTVIDEDLICYLPMNGNAMDASHFENATQVQGAPSWTTGRKSLPNTAFLMDGASNDIVIPNKVLLDTINKITLTAWIKPVSFAGVGNNAILEKAYTSHVNPYYQYKLGITGDQRLNIPASFLFCLSINQNYTVLTSDSSNT